MVDGLRLFFLFLLSMCDDIADVLVVYVASHIWREGSPKIFHLEENNQKILNNYSINGLMLCKWFNALEKKIHMSPYMAQFTPSV